VALAKTGHAAQLTIFAAVALSREPWQLALSMLLVGFQLGNTGVMLGAIRDSVPRRRIGTAMAVFGAAGPIGFAVGPVLGGVIIDRLGWGIPAVFTVSAGLSIGTALLSTFAASAASSFLVAKPPSSLITAQAAVHGYTTAFWWAAAIFAIGAIACGLLLRQNGGCRNARSSASNASWSRQGPPRVANSAWRSTTR